MWGNYGRKKEKTVFHARKNDNGKYGDHAGGAAFVR